MGIFIDMDISCSVSKEEWEKVYEETLVLVEKFPLAEIMKKKINDIDVRCLVKTKEHTEKSVGFNEVSHTGWFAEGDYISYHRAECQFLPRYLVSNYESNAGDAILGRLPCFIRCDWDDDICKHTYRLWGNKTQGESYHMYLLAIACLIEARLGDKAFVSGDITRGQCRRAVEMANEYLEKKIEMPDRCYADRFIERVNKLPLSSENKLKLFEAAYLGSKDLIYGEFVRKSFTEEVIDDYWKKEFSKYNINTIGFEYVFKEYMEQGFDFAKACSYAKLKDENGKDMHKRFVEHVMDSKLHIKEKNCEDILSINQEVENPYGVSFLFARFAFLDARNKKVNRYIPIEELREILVSELKQHDDINILIDEYLEKEAKENKIDLAEIEKTEEGFKQAVDQDASEVLNQIMDKKKKEITERYDKYDVVSYGDFVCYHDGQTIPPEIEIEIGKLRNRMDSTLEKDEYKKLLNKSAKEKCEWIVEHDKYLLIRDKDWEKIFADIENNTDSFGRYYSIMHFKFDSIDVRDFGIALMISDDLYNYSKVLAENIH